MTTLGTRYPTLAFISGGVGEAEDGIPPQPFETFCYDSALMQAKIENFNIIPYTSVLPKELYNNIVPVDSVASSFKHGAVLEVIMAANGPDWKNTAPLPPGWASAGEKTNRANSSGDGRRNMSNTSPLGSTTISLRLMPKCG
ncbi:pyruvoyl-dependent arginine decarboxylase [Bilophila wadsworthia]|uniref:pyruvoyl-dependent arginine decarboxylase n=1 Tax=Bilophila wadsworthia TaxID=35833 RepID=UPI0034661719